MDVETQVIVLAPILPADFLLPLFLRGERLSGILVPVGICWKFVTPVSALPPTHSSEAYRQAGVDLDRADAVVGIAKTAAQQSVTGDARVRLLNAIGGFSGAFELPPGYTQPVILTACDGVGTKLKLANQLNKHDTVGIDLVAMSVNDILVNGGEPLAFLDYVATSQINPPILEAILAGISEGCRQAGCALVGGETAEMPGFYSEGEYDLAGFCVGAAEKADLYPRLDRVADGDVLIGIASSGLHSNGYSLVRKIVADHHLKLTDTPEILAETLGQALITPTRIYVKPVLALLKQFPDAVNAMVHVTGGGFYDNIPRVLPKTLSAIIDKNTWPKPPIFDYLQKLSGLSDETIAYTFNWGIGYILIVKPEFKADILKQLGNDAFEIGKLKQSDKPEVIVS